MTLLVFPSGFLSWLERVALVVLGALANVVSSAWEAVRNV